MPVAWTSAFAAIRSRRPRCGARTTTRRLHRWPGPDRGRPRATRSRSSCGQELDEQLLLVLPARAPDDVTAASSRRTIFVTALGVIAVLRASRPADDGPSPQLLDDPEARALRPPADGRAAPGTTRPPARGPRGSGRGARRRPPRPGRGGVHAAIRPRRRGCGFPTTRGAGSGELPEPERPHAPPTRTATAHPMSDGHGCATALRPRRCGGPTTAPPTRTTTAHPCPMDTDARQHFDLAGLVAASARRRARLSSSCGTDPCWRPSRAAARPGRGRRRGPRRGRASPGRGRRGRCPCGPAGRSTSRRGARRSARRRG